MLTSSKKFWYAVATLVGSTVGIGLYGIPFTFQKAGFGVGLLFLIAIAGLILLRNLLYGEVVLRTHQRHQFIGYSNKYLGAVAKKVNLFIFWVAVYGSLVGIIIISGSFLSNIFHDFSSSTFSTLFVVIASILVYLGLKTVSKFDLFMMLLFGAVVIFVAIAGTGHIAAGNFNFEVGELWFLPFGVILFAMDSISGVPLVRELLVGNEQKYKKALIWGTLIPAIFYLLLTFIVVGVSGEFTSPDAISGLLNSLGPKVVFIGSLFGFLTSSTIFLNVATALKESFQEDFHFKKQWSWLWVMIPPYLLFLAGIRNFIDIIGLVGGVVVSIEAILLIFIYIKAKKNGERIPEYSILLPKWLLYLMMLIFASGAVYTLIVK